MSIMRMLTESDDFGSVVRNEGFAIVHGIDISNPDTAILRLMSTFSEPVSYGKQPMVMDVKPRDGAYPASSGGSGFFDLHTDLTFNADPPKYLGLLCLATDASGGETLLSDGKNASDLLSERQRLCLLEENIPFPSPDHVGSQPVIAPILKEIDNTRTLVRFHSAILESPQILSRRNVLAAVQQFHRNAQYLLVRTRLQTGQALIMDNSRYLHGRTELQRGESKRHLKRVYGIDQ